VPGPQGTRMVHMTHGPSQRPSSVAVVEPFERGHERRKFKNAFVGAPMDRLDKGDGPVLCPDPDRLGIVFNKELGHGERIAIMRAAGEMQRKIAARVRGSNHRWVLFDEVPGILQRRSVVAREVQRKLPKACNLL
jgi:hypothetical protein